jgi:ferredoxin-NADP reductase
MRITVTVTRTSGPNGSHPTEASALVVVRLTLTRERPPGWRGYRRRIVRDLLREVAWHAGERPLVYVCAPTPFVEAAAGCLVALGHDVSRIRTRHVRPTVA